MRRRRSLDHCGIDYLEKSVVDDLLNFQKVYSHLNFDLLSYWIEKQSSVSFPDQVAENILGSAGMKQSFFMDINSLDTPSISGY